MTKHFALRLKYGVKHFALRLKSGVKHFALRLKLGVKHFALRLNFTNSTCVSHLFLFTLHKNE